MLLETTTETLPISGGHRLRVARLGDGPVLILLHGYPDNLQIWCELAPRLADHFTVIAPDWPGMGYSDPWSGGATPFHQADRLLMLLDNWGLDQVSLVGLDMGGQPVLAFASKYPDRVHRLVVMNSLVQWNQATSWEIRILRRFGWNRLILGRFPSLVFRRAEQTFLPRGVRLPPELRVDLWGAFARPEVRAFISKLCSGYQGTLRRLSELYPTITTRTLILWAGHDQHFPVAQAESLQAMIPGSRLQILSHAEHWMPWYLAEEVANQLQTFLGEASNVTAEE